MSLRNDVHATGSGATLHGLFEHQAKIAPDRPAVVAGEQTMTYDELNRCANQLAWRLRELGVDRETLVGISVGRSADMIIGILGILKAGGAYVPMDPDYPAERLATMIEDTKARVIVSQRRFASLLPQHGASIVLLDDPDAFDEQPMHDPIVESSANDLAYVTYTSGSTGVPKGVLVTHDGVVNLVTAQNYLTVSPDDRVAALATLAFDASTFELWGPLVNGATCVVYAFGGDDLSGLVDRAEREAISILHLTSPVFRLLEPHHFRALAGVHTLLFGGDSVRLELGLRAAESFDGRLIHLYGPTETTGFATFQDVRTINGSSTRIPIGRPLANVHVRILDPDGGPVADGTAGELCIGGRGVARGYLNRPDATAERFVPDPAGEEDARLYRTGDLVRLDAEGVIHFEGRMDRQIKVRGYRIEPGEIEAALTRHTKVRDAVVVAREDGTGDKRLDAYVVPMRLSDPDDSHRLVADVRKHIVEILPKHQHPTTLSVIDTIPLTDNLKVDETRLPAPTSDSGSSGAPRSDLEITLVCLWAETFGLSEVGVDDNFFDLGGDSISAVHLSAAIARVAGRPVSVKDVFKSPTVRQLSEALSAARA